jgi:hypothetical protein
MTRFRMRTFRLWLQGLLLLAAASAFLCWLISEI